MVEKIGGYEPSLVALAPLAASVILIALIDLLDPQASVVFNPPYLPTILNIVFVTGTGVVVAALSARGYMRYGGVNSLFLGSAALAGGLASLVGGYSANFVSGNYGVTTHNIDMFLSSSLHLLSAAITFAVLGSTIATRRGPYLALVYASVGAFVALSTALVYADDVPTFLGATAPTLLRQVVLGLTIVLFALSSLLFYFQYRRSSSPVVFWYSIGLGLFAIGMFCLLFQVKNGDLSSWVGRFAQYAGGFYFLMAVVSLRKTEARGEDLTGRWALTFRNDRQELEALLTGMLNALIYGRIVVGKDGRPADLQVLDVNQAFERMTGLKKDAVVGKTVNDLVPGIEPIVKGWVEKGTADWDRKSPVRFETYMGPIGRWYEISAYSPRKGFFIATIEDRTERRKAETALRESEARYRSLYENSLDGVLLTEPDGSILSANPAARRMFGMTEEEIIGEGREGLLAIDERAEQAIQKRAKEGRATAVLTFQRRDGTLFDGEVTSSLFTDADGSVKTSMIVRDVTERRRAEEDLRRSNEELQQFAYVASHDLQEPLRMVLSYSSLLTKKHSDGLNDEARKHVRFINEGAERMRELVNDLLQYSRIDARTKPHSAVDLNLVARHVIDSLRVTIDENDAQVSVDDLPIILGDETQMAQVLQNLIGNAIKFHGESPPLVKVYVVKSPREWVIAVRDNGIGIDPKYHGKLFQMFQRLHTRDEYPGTGIGLAISRKIVERHRGRVWFESEPGKGSTFFFSLPKDSGQT